jgi:RNA polymerase sigma factor (TIGR02999 family)
MPQLTELLAQVQAGEDGARDALYAAAYSELRRLAHSKLWEGGRDALLDTTSLVHESYLRFVDAGELRAEDRRAFFAYASQVMRSVIVNNARDRLAKRRGGDLAQVTLSTDLVGSLGGDDVSILRVHEALDALKQADSRLAQVVEMRFFGGYSEQEVAQTLDVTERTVRRHWEKARILLEAMLN